LRVLASLSLFHRRRISYPPLADVPFMNMKVESGVVNKPSVQTMAKIAKAFDVSIEDLIK